MIAGTGEDGHPPLYLAALHAWIRVFGVSDVAVRSLSAFFGVLGVAAVYGFARETFGGRAGWIAALLVAVSPYHIYYSQEARNYSLLALTSVLSSWTLLRAQRDPGRARLAAYVVSTALLLYTHVFGFFTWGAQLLYLLLFPRLAPDGPSRRSWAGVQAVIVLSLLPWIGAPWALRLLAQSDPATTGLHLARPTPSTLGSVFLSYPASTVGLLLTAPWTLAGAIMGVWAARRTPGSSHRETGQGQAALLLVLCLIVPHLVPYAYSQVRVPVYIARATIAALPPFYLLAAFAMAGQRLLVSGVAAAGILAAALTAQHSYTSSLLQKEAWRETAIAVEAAARPGDLLVFDVGYGSGGFGHYARRDDLARLALSADLATPEGAAELARGRRARLWVIRFHRPSDDAAVLRAMGGGYRLVSAGRLPGIEVYLFEAVTSAPTRDVAPEARPSG